jgi:hypothetical protein
MQILAQFLVKIPCFTGPCASPVVAAFISAFASRRAENAAAAANLHASTRRSWQRRTGSAMERAGALA